MKKQLFTMLTVVSVLLAVGSLYAQIGSDRRLVANVPFDFIVGKTTLPAGQYTIGSIGNSSPALLIRGSYSQPGTIFLTHDAESLQVPVQSLLVFNRYGSRYFLARIVVAGSKRGLEVPKTRREMEMARANAAEQLVLVAQVH